MIPRPTASRKLSTHGGGNSAELQSFAGADVRMRKRQLMTPSEHAGTFAGYCAWGERKAPAVTGAFEVVGEKPVAQYLATTGPPNL
jgi:hypothetical protein